MNERVECHCDDALGQSCPWCHPCWETMTLEEAFETIESIGPRFKNTRTKEGEAWKVITDEFHNLTEEINDIEAHLQKNSVMNNTTDSTQVGPNSTLEEALKAAIEIIQKSQAPEKV